MAEDAEFNSSSQPLRGVILCCTSVPPEKRSELASRAEQMGAVHKVDLTSDVTHLIVGDIDTPKYKYVAKEREDVTVLTVAWVDAVRQLWMEGGEIDVRALETEHRLPTFAGLRICLTGFDDQHERQNIQTLIADHGAEYHGDLTKAVTHLVAHKTEGEKYKYAMLWGLKTVSLDWLLDGIERGMVLEETLYNPLMPSEERGKNAWLRHAKFNTSLGKRSREDGQSMEAPEAGGSGRRKLRRTASNKLGSQNSGIWNDIVGGGFTKSKSDNAQLTERHASESPHDVRLLPSKGKRNNATSSSGAIEPTGKENRRPGAGLDLQTKDSKGFKWGLFNGHRFYLHGFDHKKTNILHDHLLSQNAELASSSADLIQPGSETSGTKPYMIVPHDTLPQNLPGLPAGKNHINVVTEWWIERCLHRKSMTDPLQVCSRPFKQFPIPEFVGLTVCSTAFSGVDLMHVSKLVRLMGGTYDEYLSPSASILVCNTTTPNKDKLRHAFGWKVPVVNTEWLWDSVRDGIRLPPDLYLLPGSPNTVKLSSSPRSRGPEVREAEVPAESESATPVVQGDLDLQKPKAMRPRTKSSKSDVPMKEALKTRSETLEARKAEPARTVGAEIPETDQSDMSGGEADTPKSRASHQENGEKSEPTQEDSGGPSTEANHGEDSNRDPRSASPPVASITTTIAALLARKQSSGNMSRNVRTKDGSTRRQPPSRLLGRALSNTSTRSASFSRASSAESVPAGADARVTLEDSAPEPSQKVMYEDPEVQEQRERVLRKMGGMVDGVVERTKSIGVAKDIGSVGTRTRLRTPR